jgi:hypothetical protein
LPQPKARTAVRTDTIRIQTKRLMGVPPQVCLPNVISQESGKAKRFLRKAPPSDDQKSIPRDRTMVAPTV